MEGGGADLPVDVGPPPGTDRRSGLERRYAAAVAELLDLRRELATVYGSRSWRLTASLRALRTRRRRPEATIPPAQSATQAASFGAAAGHVSVIAPIVTAPATTLRETPAGLGFDLLAPHDEAAPTAAAACNAAAAAAGGDWLVIWDGTSVPRPGWLAALAASFATFPDLGMAGAVLLDRAGRIVAAGATLATDGTLLPLGAGAAPGDPEHGFAAAVDAVPAGAVMVPVALWRRFGGLDPAIASLDHALAELALRMQQAGFMVARQPAAQLVRRAAPPGDAWSAALGRWHVRRRRIALRGGIAVLGGGRTPAAPRVLFVEHFVPTPDRDSGSADLHAMLRVFVVAGLGADAAAGERPRSRRPLRR